MARPSNRSETVSSHQHGKSVQNGESIVKNIEKSSEQSNLLGQSRRRNTPQTDVIVSIFQNMWEKIRVKVILTDLLQFTFRKMMWTLYRSNVDRLHVKKMPLFHPMMCAKQ